MVLSTTTILIVEDDPLVRRLLAILVKDLVGCEPLEAADGQVALDLLHTRSVDLVISDLLMPRLSGFEVLSAMRQTPSLAKIPFILISSDHQATLDLKPQVEAILLKPFSITAVMQTVDGLLG